MERFTIETFREILNVIDVFNKADFETFIDGLYEKFHSLYLSDVEAILVFLEDEFSIKNDLNISEMTIKEISSLCEFINQISENSEQGYVEFNY